MQDGNSSHQTRRGGNSTGGLPEPEEMKSASFSAASAMTGAVRSVAAVVDPRSVPTTMFMSSPSVDMMGVFGRSDVVQAEPRRAAVTTQPETLSTITQDKPKPKPPAPIKPFKAPTFHSYSNQASISSNVPSFVISSTTGNLPKAKTWTFPIEIPQLPKNFPLSPSHEVIEIHNESSKKQLLDRLSEAFRSLSIQVRYISKPASAALLTFDNVEIFMPLWLKGGNQLVVELLPRGGDDALSRNYIDKIRRAAVGIQMTSDSILPDEDLSLEYCKALQSVEGLMRTHEKHNKLAAWDSSTHAGIETAYHMLNIQDRPDMRHLGINSLLVLVDPRKTNLSTALFVSRVVLLGTNDITNEELTDERCRMYHDMHIFLLHILQLKCVVHETNSVLDECWEVDSDDEDFFGHQKDLTPGKRHSPAYNEDMSLLFGKVLRLFTLALQLATNSASSIEGNESLSPSIVVEHFCMDAEDTTKICVISTLLESVQRAVPLHDVARPHIACNAVQCLRHMCSVSDNVKSRVEALGGIEWVRQASRVGKVGHMKLQNEAERLLGILGDTRNPG